MDQEEAEKLEMDGCASDDKLSNDIPLQSMASEKVLKFSNIGQNKINLLFKYKNINKVEGRKSTIQMKKSGNKVNLHSESTQSHTCTKICALFPALKLITFVIFEIQSLIVTEFIFLRNSES